MLWLMHRVCRQPNGERRTFVACVNVLCATRTRPRTYAFQLDGAESAQESPSIIRTVSQRFALDRMENMPAQVRQACLLGEMLER